MIRFSPAVSFFMPGCIYASTDDAIAVFVTSTLPGAIVTGGEIRPLRIGEGGVCAGQSICPDGFPIDEIGAGFNDNRLIANTANDEIEIPRLNADARASAKVWRRRAQHDRMQPAESRSVTSRTPASRAIIIINRAGDIEKHIGAPQCRSIAQKGNGHQIRAVLKRPIADACDASGNSESDQRGTIRESSTPDTCDAIWNSDAG